MNQAYIKRHLILNALALLSFTALAHAGDKEDVAAVFDKYRVYEEAGDMISQGKLMTDDRVMLYTGGVEMGDNRKGMQQQQKDQDEFQAKFPGVKYKIQIKDVKIQTWNDTALVVAKWYPTRVVPASLPVETAKKLGPAKTPLLVGATMVKLNGAWKIAFTTFVPLEKPKCPPTEAK